MQGFINQSEWDNQDVQEVISPLLQVLDLRNKN